MWLVCSLWLIFQCLFSCLLLSISLCLGWLILWSGQYFLSVVGAFFHSCFAFALLPWCWFPVWHWSLLRWSLHYFLLAGWSGFPGSGISAWLLLVLFFLGVHRILLWLYFLVCILVWSILSQWFLRPWCCLLWYGWLFCWKSGFRLHLLSCSSDFFPIHLYPLILAVSLLVSFDSEIRAISIFSACNRVCRLFVFPFMPLVLIFATISFLFFLILGLLCFLSWCHLAWVLIPLSCLVFSFIPFVVIGLLG